MSYNDLPSDLTFDWSDVDQPAKKSSQHKPSPQRLSQRVSSQKQQALKHLSKQIKLQLPKEVFDEFDSMDIDDIVFTSDNDPIINTNAVSERSDPASSPPVALSPIKQSTQKLTETELNELMLELDWSIDESPSPAAAKRLPPQVPSPNTKTPSLTLSSEKNIVKSRLQQSLPPVTGLPQVPLPAAVSDDFDIYSDDLMSSSPPVIKHESVHPPSAQVTKNERSEDNLKVQSQKSHHEDLESASPEPPAWSDWNKIQSLFTRSHALIQGKMARNRPQAQRSLDPISRPAPEPERQSEEQVKTESTNASITDHSSKHTSIIKRPASSEPLSATVPIDLTKSTDEPLKDISVNNVIPALTAAPTKRSVIKGKTTQLRLTSFISPLVHKAHASTLAADQAATEAAKEATAISTSNLQLKNKGNSVIAPIFLSEEQRKILSMVVDERRNIFFTGAAGTGKSVLLRRIILELRKKHKKLGPQVVSVTASTGLAACNIGGMTLHSFAGIGLGEETVSQLVDKIRRNRKANQRWKTTKVLIIDEISMIDGELFEKLEEIARIIRKNPGPFGGIQIVLTGDFYQLPPVFKKRNDNEGLAAMTTKNGGFKLDEAINEDEPEGKFAFDSDCWSTVVETTVELKQVFRQRDDRFSGMLNSLREGTVTDEIESSFQQLSRSLKVPGDITPTELFPLRRDVDRSNSNKMRQLPGQVVEFTASDSYMSDQAERLGKLDLLMCPKHLTVKKGAQVMLIKNLDETLVNGSLGRVLGFMSESSFALVKELPEEYAESVAKDKMSAEEALEEYLEKASKKKPDDSFFDDNDDDIEKLLEVEEERIKDNPTTFEHGIVNDEDEAVANPSETEGRNMVTRSSTRNATEPAQHQQAGDVFGLKDVSKEDIDADPFKVNWKRKQELVNLLNKTTAENGRKWPYVRFLLQDGTTRDLLVQPETWTLEDLEGKVEASRSQVPLILAWALSIHKSQGQTLEWVRVDLSKVFEAGQAYVALSRAVRMEGLQVLGFNRRKIMVHPRVIEFYASLSSALEVPALPRQQQYEEEEEEDVRPAKKQKKHHNNGGGRKKNANHNNNKKKRPRMEEADDGLQPASEAFNLEAREAIDKGVHSRRRLYG
jgi:ATP-dependent DNA helicase PIF1